MASECLYTLLLFLIHAVNYSLGFYNPILAPGQDPSVKYYNGSYYLTQSYGYGVIVVMKSVKLENLGTPDVNVTVWTGSSQVCCEVWAPELVHMEDIGRWYIYFAADDGNDANHRSYVLESSDNDPLGPYTFVGQMAVATDMWAIDSTVMTLNNQLYYIWSGYPDAVKTQQNLYIATMNSPISLSSDRFLLSEPTYPWEFTADGLGRIEGPAVLQVNGTYIAYSASSTLEDSYCLGLLTYVGGEALEQTSWLKSNSCVFAMDSSKSVYGPGHNCFTTSPDRSQVWNVYHAFETSGQALDKRNIRAQVLNWNADGTPHFGTPVGFSNWVDPPSGE